MKKDKRAVLGTIYYMPNIDRKERINVGVVLHSPEDNFLKIEFIDKLHRLKVFDDELDLDFFKLYSKAIENEFTNDFFKPIDIFDYDLIKKKSYNYVNLFRFEIEDILVYDQIEKVYADSKKRKLHYDFDKEDRLTPLQKNKIIVSSYYKEYESDIKYQPFIDGLFDEKINFDFEIFDIKVKLFEFNKNNYKHYPNQIKSWLFNAKNSQKNIIFIIEDNVNNETTAKMKNYLIEKLVNTPVFMGYNDKELIDLFEERKKNYMYKQKENVFNTLEV